MERWDARRRCETWRAGRNVTAGPNVDGSSGVFRPFGRHRDVPGHLHVVVVGAGVRSRGVAERTLITLRDLVDHLPVLEVDPAPDDLEELGGFAVGTLDHSEIVGSRRRSYPAGTRWMAPPFECYSVTT